MDKGGCVFGFQTHVCLCPIYRRTGDLMVSICVLADGNLNMAYFGHAGLK